ncbi:MAG: molybdopterin oxidoreductase [Thermoprotei archaeon]|nr:MAG: molybdopterin oxidoreductase [Thermoprotei archaeon]
MAERELTCIICPAACTLHVLVTPDGELIVRGAGCRRGVEYARQEILEPRRVVVTVVKVKNGELPVVSVKTSRPVPKSCIREIMKATAELEIEAPVEIGQVVAENICGANLIATRRVRHVQDIHGADQ